MSEAPTDSRNKTLAVLAGLAPLFGTIATCCVLASQEPQDVLHSAQSLVWVLIPAVVAVVLAVPINGVLLYLAGRGKPVPTLASFFLASIPLLMGHVGFAWGNSRALEAVGLASPSERASILAAGLSESLVSRIMGSGLSAGIFLGTGLGLALASAALRAEGRKAWGGAIGVAAALPVLALSLYAMASTGPAGFALPLVVLLLVASAALAGASAGTDGRSGAFASSSVLVTGFAALAAALSLDAASVSRVFGAVAHVSAEEKGSVLTYGLLELEPIRIASTYLAVPVLLLALALSLHAFMRKRPSLGATVSGVLLSLYAVLLAALTPLGTPSASSGLDLPPEIELADFQPVRLSLSGPPERAQVKISQTELATREHTVPVPDWGGARSLLLTEFAAARERSEADLPAYLRGEEDGWGLTLALDARLKGEPLLTILRVVAEAGIRELTFVAEPERDDSGDSDIVARRLPALVPLIGGGASVTAIVINEELTAPRMTARIEGEQITFGNGDREAIMFCRDGTLSVREGDSDSAVIVRDVTIRPDAETTMQQLASALECIRRDAPDMPRVFVRDTLGLIAHNASIEDQAGPGYGPAAVQARAQLRVAVDGVRGSLSVHVARRVLRRHLNTVRRCIRDSPSAVFRVDIVVGSDGAVTRAVTRGDLPSAAQTCVIAAHEAIVFPAPEGGGIATAAVSYRGREDVNWVPPL